MTAEPTAPQDWPAETAADAVAHLPPPRTEEPANLRQEIADELADHLACAMRRELLRGGDVATARQNVTHRFGDPSAVARQLWFDAIKARLMTNKLLTGLISVMAAALLLGGVLMWQALETNRAATAALISQSEQSQAALLASNRQTQAALLERLTQLEQKPSWASDPEWNAFRLKFVTPTGEPAAAVRLELSGPLSGVGGERVPIDQQTSDAAGDINLSPARVGRYRLEMTTDWGAILLEEVTMPPGRDMEKTVVVPSRPEQVPIQFQVADWPAALRNKAGWAIFAFDRRVMSKTSTGTWWQFSPQLVALHPDGRCVDLMQKYRAVQTIKARRSNTVASSNMNLSQHLPLQSAAPSVWSPVWIAPWPAAELPDDPNTLIVGSAVLSNIATPGRSLAGQYGYGLAGKERPFDVQESWREGIPSHAVFRVESREVEAVFAIDAIPNAQRRFTLSIPQELVDESLRLLSLQDSFEAKSAGDAANPTRPPLEAERPRPLAN